MERAVRKIGALVRSHARLYRWRNRHARKADSREVAAALEDGACGG